MSKEFRFNYIRVDKNHRELYAIAIEYRERGSDWMRDAIHYVNDECVNVAMIDDINSFLSLGYTQAETVNTTFR